MNSPYKINFTVVQDVAAVAKRGQQQSLLEHIDTVVIKVKRCERSLPNSSVWLCSAICSAGKSRSLSGQKREKSRMCRWGKRNGENSERKMERERERRSESKSVCVGGRERARMKLRK